MKKSKKIMCMFLAFTLSAGVMSACGKDKKNNISDESVIIKDELKLTVWDAQGTDFVSQESSTENIPKSWLEKKTNVKIENIYGNDGGQWDTKLSRLIAGDNMPDIFYIGGGQGPTHFKKLQSAKKLYALDKDFIQKYAPNVWKRVPEECWNMMESDGKILGIPFGFSKYDEITQPDASPEDREFMADYYKTVITNYCNLYIRDDIAKKLYPNCLSFKEMCDVIDETGEKIGERANDIPINSTDDFIKLFKDIDALGLTENGKKVFAFGYNGGDLWLPFTRLGASMYGYATNNYITAWNYKDKKIDMPLVGDEIKNAAKTQNMMIRDGIFDPESLVQTNANFKENCLNGLYAVTDISYAGGIISLNRQLEQLGKPFRYRPLNPNVPQSEKYPLQYYESPWTSAICLANNLDEREAAQVLNWINVQFSDEFEEILWWGTPEDRLYTEENGVRTYTDDRFNKRYIDIDKKALSTAECRGIGSAVFSPECEFYVLAGFRPENNRWNPRFMRKINKFNSSMTDAFGYEISGENVHKRPQCDVYDAQFVEVSECVEMWAKREQWESPFKIALGADTDESFEKQWEAAVSNINSIVDINSMCDKMTDIAKKQANELDIE